MGREKRISKKIGRAYLIILSNLFFHFFPMWHLIGQQRIKLFGVILMYQMTKFMGNDVFNWNCMVNIYLKEDKCFREHSDRIRKILRRRETFEYVEFRRESTMFKRAWSWKSEKSEDLEYLAVINYEILEYLAVINYEDLEKFVSLQR